MRQADNDNDELPFISLAAATANVMALLRAKETPENPAERAERRSETREDRCESHSVDNVSDDAAQRFSCAM